jgi:hypothetical protein
MNLEVCTCKRSESWQIIITNPACPIHGNQAPKGEAAHVNKIQIIPPWDLDSSDEDADESRNYEEEKAKKEQEEKGRALEAEERLRAHLEVLNQVQYEDERIRKETMRNSEVEDQSISRNLLNQHKRISDSGHKISL